MDRTFNGFSRHSRRISRTHKGTSKELEDLEKCRSSKQPQKLDDLIANTKQNLKGHGKAKSVWFHQRGFFELTDCKGQKKRFRVEDYITQRLQVLEQDDDHVAWQLLECRFAECEASAIAYLDALNASSSHPGPGAGSEDLDTEPPSEAPGAGSEDTDKEPPSEV